MEIQKLTLSKMKRKSIEEAARKAFREQGVDGTSMDQLAALAGVSKRTVYNHFASKEKLVMHLLKDMWQRAQQCIHVKYDPVRPLDLQLLTIVGSEIEVLCDQEYVDLARVAFGYFFYRPDALEEANIRTANQESILFRWLDAAAADGRLILDDPGFAARQLHGLIKGSCFWPQVLSLAPIPERKEQRRVAEEAVQMFLARYAAPS